MNNKAFWRDAVHLLVFISALGCLCGSRDVFGNSAKSGDDCLACHVDVWREIPKKRYAHKPDAQGNCKFCHIAGRDDKGDGSGVLLDTVKWLAKTGYSAKEHRLEFDDAKRGATVVVEANSGGAIKVKMFPLPTFDELEELPVSSQSPLVISQAHLLSVTKGIFVSAAIAWETDSPADSQVFYGIDKLDHTSMLDRQPVTDHVVVLTGVQLGKTYKYKVVSTDFAGNRVESAVKSMIVEPTGPEKQEQVGRLVGRELEVKMKSYRRGNKCLVVVSIEPAASVRLGLLPKKYADDSSGDEKVVIRHLPLSSPEVTNTGICYSCHAEYRQILTHPINVYPKRGMIIPPEYATLPDGRISCMSCHVTHASDIEFRLVKASKEELCRGCHRDMR